MLTQQLLVIGINLNYMNNVQEQHHCLACGSENLELTLDLGAQPLANSYVKDITLIEDKYPLAVNLCKDCCHLQLTHIVDPQMIYKNYLYVAGTSKTLKDYSNWFANWVTETSTRLTNRVLDIGCNDGSQLDSFKSIGWETWGVDPAENIYPTSSANHEVLCDFFGPDIINKIDTSFDAITAQNVVAHNPNPLAFLRTCHTLMNNNTMLYVQTSQATLVANNEFDSIYHEHVNFFNIQSMSRLAARAGLTLVDAIKTPIHGTSYVYVFSKSLEAPAHMENVLAMESLDGLYNVERYATWRTVVEDNMRNLKTTLCKYQEDGFTIVGYGAAAKGNTLLNYIDFKLDLIIDDNPLKQNLYTPGQHIPIVDSAAITKFNKEDKILFVPLAWNFFKEISSKIKAVRTNDNDVFLKYFPTVETVNV